MPQRDPRLTAVGPTLWAQQTRRGPLSYSAPVAPVVILVIIGAEDPGPYEADPLLGARPLLGRPRHRVPHEQVLLGLRGEHALRGVGVVGHARVEGGLGRVRAGRLVLLGNNRPKSQINL